jgi:hypothetical protein
MSVPPLPDLDTLSLDELKTLVVQGQRMKDLGPIYRTPKPI